MATILILEDDADTRDALVESLEACGYEVRPCGHRDEALAQARRPPVPDLILSDLNVPGEGRLFARLLRQDPDLSKVPLFLTTGSARVTFEEVQQLGANAVFRKPFEVDKLLRAINRIVRPAGPA